MYKKYKEIFIVCMYVLLLNYCPDDDDPLNKPPPPTTTTTPTCVQTTDKVVERDLLLQEKEKLYKEMKDILARQV